jgi:hypothetical protein
MLAALLMFFSLGCKKEEESLSPEEIEKRREVSRQAASRRDAQMKRAPEISIASESDLYQKDTTKLIGTKASTGAGGYDEKQHPMSFVSPTKPATEKDIRRARTIEY